MARKQLTADEKLELKQYIAQELTARTAQGTLDISQGKGYTALVEDITHKFNIPTHTARRHVENLVTDQALFLPVHDVLRQVLTDQQNIASVVAGDIRTYEADYKAAAEPKDASVFGSLKQKALQNAINVSKAQIELLHKIGGLSMASKKLNLEEERHEQAQTAISVSEQLNYSEMSKEEVDSKLYDIIASGKTDALDTEEIVNRETLIDE